MDPQGSIDQAPAVSADDRRIAFLAELWRTVRDQDTTADVRELAQHLVVLSSPEVAALQFIEDDAALEGTSAASLFGQKPLDADQVVAEEGRLSVGVPRQLPGGDPALRLVIEIAPGVVVESFADYVVAISVVVGAALDRVHARLGLPGSETAGDALWRAAILRSFRDPILMFDAEGQVLELNQAFTDLFGYSLEDGPIRPPYPWWPGMKEDAERHAESWAMFRQAMADAEVDAEVLFYTRDRRPVWVHTTGSSVSHPLSGTSARIRVLRDITRERQARARRATAAEVCAAFGQFDDLGSLLGCAEHAFGILFNGGSTIQVEVGERYLFGSGRRLTAEDLVEDVVVGLAGSVNPDTASLRPGILLVPGSTTAGARAWVQFPRPRRISADEMVAADLLAHAFGLAVDRLVDAQRAADRTANLHQAVESHRLIGQAVGILVERHRLTPAKAFDLLRAASQERNLKLREVAVRVIETGVDPSSA